MENKPKFYDVPTLISQIKSEEAWHQEKRHSTVLSKAKGLSVTLVAMHAVMRIPSHRSKHELALLVLEGRLRVVFDGKVQAVSKGQLMMLEAGMPHGIESEEESAFLLISPSKQTRNFKKAIQMMTQQGGLYDEEPDDTEKHGMVGSLQHGEGPAGRRGSGVRKVPAST